MQVHKETIDKVPNSLPNRGNIEIEIYGMEGIPDADLKAHENAKNNEDEDEPSAKRAKSDSPALMPQPIAGRETSDLRPQTSHLDLILQVPECPEVRCLRCRWWGCPGCTD